MTRISRRGLVVVLAVCQALIAVLPYAAPYAAEEQHRAYPLAPPTAIHVSLRHGVFVCALVPAERFAEYREDCSTTYRVRFVETSATSGLRLISVDRPGAMFLMGTDELGRDLASQFLVGARQSLLAAEAATGLSLLIAIVVGLVSGYRGGVVDRVCLRIGDIFMALPWLYAILALRGALPLSVDAGTMTVLTILLLSSIGWVRPARVFRALVAATRSQGFVQAAVGFGAPMTAVLTRHFAPVVAGAALTQAAVLIPQFLLAEVALSVLGVLGDSASGWGPLVATLQRYAMVSSAWWLALPAIFVVGVLVVSHKLADASQRSLRLASARGAW